MAWNGLVCGAAGAQRWAGRHVKNARLQGYWRRNTAAPEDRAQVLVPLLAADNATAHDSL